VTPLVRRIDAILPQTQCTKCGYDGCRPYAEAIAAGGADINQCPPGGDEGVEKLAALLNRDAKPLNPVNGLYRAPQVAVIDEAVCIGCTKCIHACPVDAIVGASKLMHTVIASWCTGCELCIPPCPVDCIALSPVPQLPEADLSRDRHDARATRLARDASDEANRLASYE
jgi:H+/Na+-translocating ferredoxin:NAD+ oxidoreductase subunit B